MIPLNTEETNRDSSYYIQNDSYSLFFILANTFTKKISDEMINSALTQSLL